MSKITNRTVLITGGASGIGRLLGLSCAAEGAHCVALWDINEAKLLETKLEFEAKGYAVYIDVVDVADAEDLARAVEALKSEIGMVDILFNNAGIVVGKPFKDHSLRDIDKTLDINVRAVMQTTWYFLPEMLDQREGHIINIASAAGLIANPNMSVYASSKWAVLGWSESLRLEMEEGKTGVHVTTVMPSYIDTGMFAGVKAPMLTPILKPEYITEKIMEAVHKNEILLQEPFMVKSLPILKGVLPPRVFDFVAGRLFGVYKTMDNFVGKPAHEAVPDKEKLKRE